MKCVICGTPVHYRNSNTCSSDCRKIRDSKLTSEEYWRQQSQIPQHENERSHELDDADTVERVVKIGMMKEL